MTEKSLFPILEFDPDRSAKIEPSKLVAKRAVPKACVIAFFSEVIRHKLEAGLLKEFAEFRSGTPIYETLLSKQLVGLARGYVGAPGAACQLEELVAMGFEKFMVCGGAGVLRRDAVRHRGPAQARKPAIHKGEDLDDRRGLSRNRR